MKEFLRVVSLGEALRRAVEFEPLAEERVSLDDALYRVAASDVRAGEDLPPFPRATMDGFAVVASATFGASESSPALLTLRGEVAMGERPSVGIVRGDAMKIATGGVLPPGADAVVMMEHVDAAGERQIEARRPVAPGDHVLGAGEDALRGQPVVVRGTRLRPQELGLLAALGVASLEVVRRPRVGILSTGDELVPLEAVPTAGQIRDVNGTTLAAMVVASGGIAVRHPIVPDDLARLGRAARALLEGADALLVSGGSSVGARDFTDEMLAALPGAERRFQGVALRPGKPTILARAGNRPLWGLPGQVTSAMVVFELLVRPCLESLAGCGPARRSAWPVRATLTRNVPSVHGRTDLVRVRLEERAGTLWAAPVLGPSGLLRTMVEADGVVRVEQDVEGLYQGAEVSVSLL